MSEEEQIEAFETANEREARQHILTRKHKRKEKIVSVPEWGEDGKPMMVLIRSLSGDQRSEYFHFSTVVREQYAKRPDFYKRLWFEQVRLGCLHPVTEQPLFQFADLDEVMRWEDGGTIELLAAVVREVSGLNRSVVDEVKKI